MKKSKLSLREVVLLLLLIVVLICVYIVKGPLQSQLNDINDEKETLIEDIATMEPYIYQMDQWQKELDALRAEYGDDLQSIPEYNYIREIERELGTYLDASGTAYSIQFSEENINETIASRTFSVSFSCSTFAQAYDNIKGLDQSATRYRIQDLSVISGSDGSCNVSMNILVYEYVEQ